MAVSSIWTGLRRSRAYGTGKKKVNRAGQRCVCPPTSWDRSEWMLWPTLTDLAREKVTDLEKTCVSKVTWREGGREEMAQSGQTLHTRDLNSTTLPLVLGKREEKRGKPEGVKEYLFILASVLNALWKHTYTLKFPLKLWASRQSMTKINVKWLKVFNVLE